MTHANVQTAADTGQRLDIAATHQKLENLKDYLRELGSVAVAFSGGVDSTFLMKVAQNTLEDRALAITARLKSFPERECTEAIDFCHKEGIRHIAITFDELSIPGFSENPPDRCYLCKRALFTQLMEDARERGFSHLCEGSNMDDEGDYRPGLKAVAELGVKSPLRHARLHKAEIRALSHEMNLPTWDKPSFACLSSRFPYGEEITDEKLKMVGKAERLLLDLGFRQERVRIHGGGNHGSIARIEVPPSSLQRLLDERERVSAALRSYGFAYVTMDLMGYRTGSMNETLPQDGRA